MEETGSFVDTLLQQAQLLLLPLLFGASQVLLQLVDPPVLLLLLPAGQLQLGQRPLQLYSLCCHILMQNLVLMLQSFVLAAELSVEVLEFVHVCQDVLPLLPELLYFLLECGVVERDPVVNKY